MKKDEILALAGECGFKLDWAISNCTGQFESFYHAAIESYKAELLKEVEKPVGLVTFVDGECYSELSDTAKLVEFDELFTSDQVAAAILKATGPLEEEVERLKIDVEFWKGYSKAKLDDLLQQLATLTKQRDLAVEGITRAIDMVGNPDNITYLQQTLDAIKESEAK